jgi:hypothetical protein
MLLLQVMLNVRDRLKSAPNGKYGKPGTGLLVTCTAGAYEQHVSQTDACAGKVHLTNLHAAK